MRGMCMGVLRSVWVCAGLPRYAWMRVRVWDEFSEFLLENRVLTSADFNTYPIRIFNLPMCFIGWKLNKEFLHVFRP